MKLLSRILNFLQQFYQQNPPDFFFIVLDCTVNPIFQNSNSIPKFLNSIIVRNFLANVFLSRVKFVAFIENSLKSETKTRCDKFFFFNNGSNPTIKITFVTLLGEVFTFFSLKKKRYAFPSRKMPLYRNLRRLRKSSMNTKFTP